MPADAPHDELGERERLHRVSVALDRAAGGGFLPFDRFMEIALYSEPDGFYARPRSPLGPTGDFYTAAHVHPIFGRAIARRIRAVRNAVAPKGPFRVVEMGPGDGTLAASIIPDLADLAAPDSPLNYVIVERSSALRDRTIERIAPLARAAGIGLTSLTSVGADGPFAGVVLANEFLDALPVRRLRWSGSVWHELGVRREGKRWVVAEDGEAASVPGAPLPHSASPGATLEISPMAEGFVREIADHLTVGLTALIDFGMSERELLAAHPSGTLAGVREHREVPDPLSEPGASDLSAFVNFDRIRAAATKAGLHEISFRSQAEALGAWGFADLLEDAIREAGSSVAEVRLRLAAKNLLFGFERFRVLELAAPLGAEAVRSIR